MDIQKEVHGINNKRQLVSYCLDFDATKAEKSKAMKIFNETTNLLNEIARTMTPRMKEDACKSKGCPHYALWEDNGCTIYRDISICVDSRKGA